MLLPLHLLPAGFSSTHSPKGKIKPVSSARADKFNGVNESNLGVLSA